jgi:hypothetical protein
MQSSTKAYIDAGRIPQERIEAMARPALEAVRKAFEDPTLATEFRAWQLARQQQKNDAQ